MKLNIDLKKKDREAVLEILNTLLADEFILSTKTRNCHWNVTGAHFHDLHKFFDAQYEQLDEVLDAVAERARALGGHAVGTLKETLKLARLKEQPGKYPPALQMIAELLDGHEVVIRQLRVDVEKCAKEVRRRRHRRFPCRLDGATRKNGVDAPGRTGGEELTEAVSSA
jgi:starvation-inducible DNA-binding protein